MKTESIHLGDNEGSTLCNICTVAAEQYRAHAKTMREGGFHSLAAQFDRQARDAQTWAHLFSIMETGVLTLPVDEDDEHGDAA